MSYHWTPREHWRALRIRPGRERHESLRACLVGLWYAWVLGVETESCQRCGKAGRFTHGSWWHAHDDDWISVMGHLSGCLCMRCFVTAWEKEHPGRLIYWQATKEVAS